jgi:hypothetical protein
MSIPHLLLPVVKDCSHEMNGTTRGKEDERKSDMPEALVANTQLFLVPHICSCIVVINCSEERCDIVTVSSPGEAHGGTRPNQGPGMDERPVCLCRLPGVRTKDHN